MGQRLIIFSFIFLLFPAPISMAQSNAPLKIEAQNSLEWHRDENKFIARGDVDATQGETTILCDTLTATYGEGAAGRDFDLQNLIAEGNVRLKSEDGTAYGARADYDVAAARATLSGGDLKLVAQDITVTARERFEYDLNAGMLNTVGGGTAIQQTEKGQNTITADRLSAAFKQQTANERELDRMEATGNVVITTPTETVTGDKGVYRKDTNTATLTGNVTIKRDDNILTGERATVNLNTNVSTLFGGKKGKVSGTFYPGKE